MVKTALALLVGGAVPLALLGCGGPSERVEGSSAALRRVQSCEELTQALRDDARSKMNRRVDAEVRAVLEGYESYAYPHYPGVSVGLAPTAGAADNGTGAVQDASSPQPGPATSTPAHSETETQVKGVDEADIVKADGTRLYVLHGQKFLIVDAWPAQTLGVAGEAEIEGQPVEMFVADGKAVVFSSVDGTPIYSAAGITPRPSFSDANSYGGGYATDLAMPADGPSPQTQPSQLTKVTVLGIDGAKANVVRELYFEGGYLSSRRIGAQVRVVLQGGAHGPVLDYNAVYGSNSSTTPSDVERIAAWEKLRTKNEAAIGATTYQDWVPQSFLKNESGVAADAVSCSDFFVPSAGSTEFGMTQIQAFDLEAPAEPPQSVTIVGAADTVYGGVQSMVLAARSYTDPWLVRQNYAMQSGVTGASMPPVQTLNHTDLHLFDFSADARQPAYVASGVVPGSVKDQFSLDEKGGRVRVTTTEQRSGPALSDGRQNEVSHVFVLENAGDSLKIVGDAGEIAPGEQLYATRYVGDKAYVVTWHVTDPLFVIDLSNPTRPTVLGQLEIPGFSEYMHPLDDTHLLTIGRETDDTGHQHTDSGYWYGLSIQVFDVTDPLAPRLQHKLVYDGGEYATSEATQNHKAFTYFDDRKLLAFPYVRQIGYGASPGSGPSSTLEVYRVDIDDGIQKLGSVDHSSLLGTTTNGMYGYCGGYFDGAVRRGVFFENIVYSISYGGILANDISALAQPIASLKLPAPSMQNVCY